MNTSRNGARPGAHFFSDFLGAINILSIKKDYYSGAVRL